MLLYNPSPSRRSVDVFGESQGLLDGSAYKDIQFVGVFLVSTGAWRCVRQARFDECAVESDTRSSSPTI